MQKDYKGFGIYFIASLTPYLLGVQRLAMLLTPYGPFYHLPLSFKKTLVLTRLKDTSL
jgi:hypothetical protein